MLITSDGRRTQPDIVASSERLHNYLACDCKGGTTIEQDQLDRYASLNRSALNLELAKENLVDSIMMCVLWTWKNTT